MTHITRRKHIIQWLIRNCSRKSVVRAIEEGMVEHLGSFSNLGPAPTKPGWIVKVTGEHGTVWLVEVVGRLKLGGFGVYITHVRNYNDDSVVWHHWQGDTMNIDPTVPRELYDLWEGDNPIEYARLRDERNRETEEANRKIKDEEQGTELQS